MILSLVSARSGVAAIWLLAALLPNVALAQPKTVNTVQTPARVTTSGTVSLLLPAMSIGWGGGKPMSADGRVAKSGSADILYGPN